MSYPSTADVEIIRNDQKRLRRKMVARMSLPFAILAFGAGWALFRRSHAIAGISLLVAAGFLLTLFVIVYRLNRSQEEANAPRILRMRADELRYRRNRELLTVPFITLCFTLNAIISPQSYEWMHAALLVMIVGCGAMIVAGVGIKRRAKSVMEDELSASFRNRALRAGFWTFLLSNCVVYPVSIFDPPMVPRLLPWCLWSGVAVPALYFIYLEWMAGRGE